jgi:hypothetical protein
MLRNLIGWILILASFVAGPVVPGPGGIPMFLIGFALITFPGKRRLTARVFRGRPIRLWTRATILITIAVATLASAITLLSLGTRFARIASIYGRGPLAVVGFFISGAAGAWISLWALLGLVQLFLRIMPRVRRRVRPWLRRHHIRLLPPRWRQRLPHEPGTGPHRLKDEILSFLKRRARHPDGAPSTHTSAVHSRDHHPGT